MTLEDKNFLEEVPEEDAKYVKRLRRDIRDFIEKNELRGIEENTDLEIYYSLINTALEIKSEIGYITQINDLAEIPWNILSSGATIDILENEAIRSARNTLSYNDAGGINVQETDVYGRYVNLFNMFQNRYQASVRSWKASKNIENCYGGLHSDYVNLDY
jgi:hypothetical protein